jgi:hypothetical protein
MIFAIFLVFTTKKKVHSSKQGTKKLKNFTNFPFLQILLVLTKKNVISKAGLKAPYLELEPDSVPLVKKDKIMLKRLEIRSTKSKIGVTDLTWVNEEVKDIEKEDEKSLVVNEIALMIPYLNR